VKISKKNVCLVTIVKGDDAEKQEDERQRLLEFYLSQKDPTWGQQFKNAVMLGPQIDEDNLVLEDVEPFDALSHFLTIFWKAAFATVPPIGVGAGKAAFAVSLAYIGVVTAVVGEFAELLGCVVGIDESVTAITLVALGTSLPDTFASMTAARSSEYADSAIGNITGSNSVNVFLGLGLPWAVAATYWAHVHPTKQYLVPAGAVAFSVFVFLIVAVVCFLILIGRRVVSTPLLFSFIFYLFFIGRWWRARRTKRQQNRKLRRTYLPLGCVLSVFYFERRGHLSNGSRKRCIRLIKAGLINSFS
jgi:solute carrier family 8 (sodium/calcium exchanger)